MSDDIHLKLPSNSVPNTFQKLDGETVLILQNKKRTVASTQGFVLEMSRRKFRIACFVVDVLLGKIIVNDSFISFLDKFVAKPRTSKGYYATTKRNYLIAYRFYHERPSDFTDAVEAAETLDEFLALAAISPF